MGILEFVAYCTVKWKNIRWKFDEARLLHNKNCVGTLYGFPYVQMSRSKKKRKGKYNFSHITYCDLP